MDLGTELKYCLMAAWLLPLFGFIVEVLAGFWSHRLSKAAAYWAVGCIGAGFVLSSFALFTWWSGTDAGHRYEVFAQEHGGHAEESGEHDAAHHKDEATQARVRRSARSIREISFEDDPAAALAVTEAPRHGN